MVRLGGDVPCLLTLGQQDLDTLRHCVKLGISDIQDTHRRTHPRERDEEERNGDGPADQGSSLLRCNTCHKKVLSAISGFFPYLDYTDRVSRLRL